MEKKNDKNKVLSGKEPVFIVKPVLKNHGLDYLHITLIALVIILIVLAFALSTFKQAAVVTNCQYGVNANGICNETVHNSTQVLQAADRYLAAYSNVNTSLSLLSYYVYVNRSTVNYLANSKQWVVTTPYLDPLANNSIYNISLVMYDSNLTLANSYLETLKPAKETNNSVVALGTVSINGEAECKYTTPIPVYVVDDPYSPGTIQTLNATIKTAKLYGNKINVTYFFIFSGYSEQYYKGFGIPQTQQLGRYLSCASRQPAGFQNFVSNLSIAYTGKPLANQTLYQIVQGSDLNITDFNGCMQNVTTSLNIQAQFASLYNIISTPQVVVNCKYSTIPQTINDAINYSLKNING
jgi:hypothetical protein